LTAPRTAAGRALALGYRLENARVVAEYWRDEMMSTDGPLRACSHPLAMVLAALDGETNPMEMGTPPDEFARRRALLRREVGDE
jgi:hypothetical protein